MAEPRTAIRLAAACLAVALAATADLATGSSSVLASDVIAPLEVTNVRAGMPSRSRWSRAHPGLEYSVRPAVIGGVFPYHFSLSQAPEGMTIDAATGDVRWDRPSGTASPMLTVVDAAGSQVTASWTIQVTAEGFRFVDAVNGKATAGPQCAADCGQGTRERPWRTIGDVLSAGRSGDFVYFRSGTYSLRGLPIESGGSGWDRVTVSESRQPVVWLAEPGQTPLIDFADGWGSSKAPLIRFRGDHVYVEGFETTNSRFIAFQYEGGGTTGPTFRKLRMHHHGPGVDGSNAAFIMTTTSAQPSDFMVVQDSEFWAVTGSAVTIKIYAQRKMLIENTVHHTSPVGIELKDDVRQFTVRGNRFFDIAGAAIGGNMHESTTSGEILFNNARAGVALDVNQDGMAGPIHIRRNTLVGRVQVRNTDAADGPFVFTNNVIVSSDSGPQGSRIAMIDVAAPGRVQLNDNLTGSPSSRLVDEVGNLAPGRSKGAGTHGHQLRR